MKQKLRTRLAIRYGAVVAACFALFLVIANHEMAELRTGEREDDDDDDDDEREESEEVVKESGFGSYAEIGIYGAMVAVFALGWLVVRRSLLPISDLAHAVDGIRAENLEARLPRSHNGDEVDRMAASFNAMAARLEQSFRQLGEFTLHASHELKTPLAVIRGEVEKALESGQVNPEEFQRFNQCLLAEVDRLGTIVNGLVLLSKGEAGILKLENKPLAFDALVAECHEDAMVLAESDDITVMLDGCDRITLNGDRHRLRQMLLNLADNAVKYNVPGGTIRMSLRRDGGNAVFTITNTGPGVAKEDEEKVFDRFKRGGDALSRKIDGCGLGLSIVRWVARGHGGDANFASEAGGLTTVTVILPAAENE